MSSLFCCQVQMLGRALEADRPSGGMGQDQNAGHGGERDGRHDTTHAVHRRCQIHFGFGSAAILEKYKARAGSQGIILDLGRGHLGM